MNVSLNFFFFTVFPPFDLPPQNWMRSNQPRGLLKNNQISVGLIRCVTTVAKEIIEKKIVELNSIGNIPNCENIILFFFSGDRTSPIVANWIFIGLKSVSREFIDFKGREIKHGLQLTVRRRNLVAIIMIICGRSQWNARKQF